MFHIYVVIMLLGGTEASNTTMQFKSLESFTRLEDCEQVRPVAEAELHDIMAEHFGPDKPFDINSACLADNKPA